MIYILVCIAITILLASVVPLCQYIYYTYVYKESSPLKYLFSDDLYNRHLNGNIRYFANNKRSLDDMWREELKHELP